MIYLFVFFQCRQLHEKSKEKLEVDEEMEQLKDEYQQRQNTWAAEKWQSNQQLDQCKCQLKSLNLQVQKLKQEKDHCVSAKKHLAKYANNV